MRVASLDTPIPFDTGLEQQFLAKGRFAAAVTRLMEF